MVKVSLLRHVYLMEFEKIILKLGPHFAFGDP
jgi:hypothetical protein